MSQSGQKWKSPLVRLTSALPPKTDMERSQLPYIVTTLKVVVRMILCSSRTPEIPCSSQKFPGARVWRAHCVPGPDRLARDYGQLERKYDGTYGAYEFAYAALTGGHDPIADRRPSRELLFYPLGPTGIVWMDASWRSPFLTCGSLRTKSDVGLVSRSVAGPNGRAQLYRR